MQRRHDLAGVLRALHLLRRALPRSRRRRQGAQQALREGHRGGANQGGRGRRRVCHPRGGRPEHVPDPGRLRHALRGARQRQRQRHRHRPGSVRVQHHLRRVQEGHRQGSPRRSRQVLPLQDGHVRRHRRSRPRGQDPAQADEGTAGVAQDGLQRRPPRRRCGGAVQDAPRRRVRVRARPRRVGGFLRRGPGVGHGGFRPVRHRQRAQRRHHRLQRL
mmetsp:Transcript_15020/g.63216  ORF Transcript_15020/g.63216 Transcript_15020/m.63216 type:complete len:217 (-) Transcript_15020:1426-2076(-)